MIPFCRSRLQEPPRMEIFRNHAVRVHASFFVWAISPRSTTSQNNLTLPFGGLTIRPVGELYCRCKMKSYLLDCQLQYTPKLLDSKP